MAQWPLVVLVRPPARISRNLRARGAWRAAAEEAALFGFAGRVPGVDERGEPVGGSEGCGALLVAGARDVGGELGVDLGAVVGIEGEAVEDVVAPLVEPDAGAGAGRRAHGRCRDGRLSAASTCHRLGGFR